MNYLLKININIDKLKLTRCLIVRALFIEAYAPLNETIRYYGKGKDSIMQPFNFMLLTKLSQKSRPKDFRDVILSWVDSMPAGAAANWVVSRWFLLKSVDD